MTLSLDLTPDEERRVLRALSLGIDITAMLKGIIAGLPAPNENEGSPNQDQTLALLNHWRQEDTTDSDEELEQRDAELHEFTENMNANRIASGEEPVFHNVRIAS